MKTYKHILRADYTGFHLLENPTWQPTLAGDLQCQSSGGRDVIQLMAQTVEPARSGGITAAEQLEGPEELEHHFFARWFLQTQAGMRENRYEREHYVKKCIQL